MNKTKIAICYDPRKKRHSGSWITPWVEYCKQNDLDYSLLDGYSFDIISKIRDYHILLWHFSGYSFQDMLISRSVIYSAKQMGLKVFPDFNSAWHFDDKIAETYLLQSINAPIPFSIMIYSLKEAIKYIDNTVKFPVVAKLRLGSGSYNVKLLKSTGEAKQYAKMMFGKGIKSNPSLILKTKSNIRSSTNWRTAYARIKRIPEFMRTLSGGKQFPNERGYIFFQEFIPNDGYDIKVVVVGNKLSYICRNTRKNDFRASGGGDLFFDKKLVSKNIIDSAFNINDDLGFQCMGFDYVVDNRNGLGKIVEISYGFSHTALLQSQGYFNREGLWFQEPLNAPEEVIKRLLPSY